MRKLEIESLEELENIFRERSVDMTNNIREGIQEAFDHRARMNGLSSKGEWSENLETEPAA